MTKDTRMITMEQLDDAFGWNEERTELLRSRHHFRKAKSFEAAVTDRGNHSHASHTITRADCPDAFAAIEAHFDTRIAALEAQIRALGVEPSVWTPPKDGGDEA